MAMALIDAAADAGADIVKFQTFDADRLVTKNARKADYQMKATATNESQWEMLKRLELSPAMHEKLIAHAAKRGIEFFSTAFDLDSLDYLLALGMSRIKVPSGELTNLLYLRKVGGTGKPVILSTGMANLGEIEAALAALEAAGTPRNQITVLHCSTEYPAPMDEVNLQAMPTMGRAFGVQFGYSDHTDGIEVAIAAVAMGASVIEKHFTLDRALPGPDHRASIEPEELARMVRSIRNIELALGDCVKRPSASEEKNRLVARKSLFAACAIVKGQLFSEQNLVAKRPGTGISPMRLDELLGRPAARDFAADELIQL
jgi:N,N'-diacetyllegionaminate synthase